MDVKFTIAGVRNAQGKVRGLAFVASGRKGFPESRMMAVAEAETQAKVGEVELVFKNVPEEASFSFFHDEKETGKIEKNFLGIPKSGVGASNWAGRGRPSFEKCLVRVTPKAQVRLHYF